MNRENDIQSNVDSVWKEISEVDNISDVLDLSEDKIQIIYKHSHRCGVCFIAKEELNKISNEILSQADLYMVDVIDQRAISSTIAHQLKIRHESPQIIILEGGEVKWKGSHWDVTSANVRKHLLQE